MAGTPEAAAGQQAKRAKYGLVVPKKEGGAADGEPAREQGRPVSFLGQAAAARRGGSLGPPAQRATAPSWRAPSLEDDADEPAPARRRDEAPQPRAGAGGGRPATARGASAWAASFADLKPTVAGSAAQPSSTTATKSTVNYARDRVTFDGRGANTEQLSTVDAAEVNLPPLDPEVRAKGEQALMDDWYGRDEDGGTAWDVSDGYTPFVTGDDEVPAPPPAPHRGGGAVTQQRLARRDGTLMSLAESKRRSQSIADSDLWERNRMRQGGAIHGAQGVDTSLDDLEEERVVLVFHDAKPPFLDGRVVFTRQHEPVLPIKDPTSDLAVISKKTPAIIKERRAKVAEAKSRDRFWDVAGTKMGKLIGAVADTGADGGAPEEAAADAAPDDHRAASQFAAHIGGDGDDAKAAEPQTEFTKQNTIAEQRTKLPVYGVRDALLQIIRENVVVVVVGETGSGKTTQLTQYLYEDGYASGGHLIGCTQPRRVAAVSVAKRVSEEMGVELGKEVGYSIRFEDMTDSDATRIKYMTDGILLRETLKDASLDKYRVVIMDEAHERSLNTDVLFGIMKRVLRSRMDFKLIVTSATMNAERFSTFFGNVPIFHIPGRTFPVDVLYSRTVCEDYVEAAVKQVLAIHLGNPPGDVLVFLTGMEEIEACCFELTERMERVRKKAEEDGGEKAASKVPPLLVLPMYSQLSSDLQARIFQPAPKGCRKCIVATNVAETSLTVDGILYVVDAGYQKYKVYSAKMGMDALQVYPSSQAAANQRSGRAGRTGPGTCYRMYTEHAFIHEMLESAVPEIQRTNLAQVVLLLKGLGVENLLNFDFLDAPPKDILVASMHQLYVLGALDARGALTDLGRALAELPLEPALGKLLVLGCKAGCTNEALAVSAMLSVPPVFFRPSDRQEAADAAREKFIVADSDHLTLLNVYEQWRRARGRGGAAWCDKHYLHVRALQKADEVRGQLSDVLTQRLREEVGRGAGAGAGASGTVDGWEAVRRCVAAAYAHHAARSRGVGQYVDVRSGVSAALHGTSALYGSAADAEYIVYHELILLNGKEYVNQATAVDPRWLAEDAPLFFSVIEGGAEARLRVKSKDAEIKAFLAGEAAKMAEDAAGVVARRGGGGGGGGGSVGVGGWKRRRGRGGL